MLYDDDNKSYDRSAFSQDSSLLDILIGRRIRSRRTILGITQKDLGTLVGVSPQQIQKYETASNRVACSTLYAFSQYLKTPVDYFFKNKEDEGLLIKEDQESFKMDEIQEKEIIKLINLYKSISSKNLRKKVYELLEAMSAKETHEA